MSYRALASSRLTRPDFISNLPHELKLLYHIAVPKQVAVFVTSKRALRTHAQSLESLSLALPGNSSNERHSLSGFASSFPRCPPAPQIYS